MSGKPNTSKTAHVMNLLSKTHPITPVSEQTPQEEQTPPAVQKPKETSVPPMIAALAPDAAVASSIKSALEESLEAELAAELSEETPPPIPPAREIEPPALSQPEHTPPSLSTPLVSPTPLPDFDQEEPLPSTEETPSPAPETEELPPADDTSDFTLVDVMQLLVEEKKDRYIKMFGLCSCERCAADVVAFALNGLQPKYMVLPKTKVIPYTRVYEHKLSSTVTAQILRACQVVAENPRHKV